MPVVNQHTAVKVPLELLEFSRKLRDEYIAQNEKPKWRVIHRKASIQFEQVLDGGVLQIDEDALRKRVRTYAPTPLDDNALDRASKRQKFYDREEPVLADIPLHLDDSKLFYEYVQYLSGLNRYVRVFVFSDAHIPDTNWDAVRLAVEIARESKPDLIVFAGDMCDFSEYGSWGKDPRYKEADALKSVDNEYYTMVQWFNEACPNTPIVAFGGNHEDRFYRQGGESKSFRTDEENVIDLFRADGRVWWIYGQQEIYMSPLFVQHGMSSGANPLIKTLTKDGMENWVVVMGHAHRIVSHFSLKRLGGNDGRPKYTVRNSVVLGAHCKLVPHYQRTKTKQHNSWVSSAVFDVKLDENPLAGEVNTQHLVYNITYMEGKPVYWVMYGSKRLDSRPTAITLKTHSRHVERKAFKPELGRVG